MTVFATSSNFVFQYTDQFLKSQGLQYREEFNWPGYSLYFIKHPEWGNLGVLRIQIEKFVSCDVEYGYPPDLSELDAINFYKSFLNQRVDYILDVLSQKYPTYPPEDLFELSQKEVRYDFWSKYPDFQRFFDEESSILDQLTDEEKTTSELFQNTLLEYIKIKRQMAIESFLEQYVHGLVQEIAPENFQPLIPMTGEEFPPPKDEDAPDQLLDEIQAEEYEPFFSTSFDQIIPNEGEEGEKSSAVEPQARIRAPRYDAVERVAFALALLDRKLAHRVSSAIKRARTDTNTFKRLKDKPEVTALVNRLIKNDQEFFKLQQRISGLPSHPGEK
jgi:hypothetical protein